MHQVEAFVDVFQWHGVGDQVIDIDLAVHVPVYDFGDIGTTTGAAEGTAAPYAAGDQLEGTSGNFLPGTGYTDNH